MLNSKQKISLVVYLIMTFEGNPLIKWKYHGSTIFILIAAHAPISTHVSYFEVINHNMINHLPRSVQKLTYQVQYDCVLA